MSLDIQITHHALRRYIERVVGVHLKAKNDYEAIGEFEDKTGVTRTEIYNLINRDVTPRLPITVIRNRTRRVIKGENARYVVDNGSVITCYRPDQLEAAE